MAAHGYRPLASVILLLAFAGCVRSSVDAAATPPQPTTERPTGATPQPTRVGYTEADVRFMQGMISHHAQALAMTELVPTRTSRPEIRSLAERIEVSQRDEIEMMQAWLATRNESVPSADPHHQHHGGDHSAMMPGMLTQAELAQLAQATGAAFERLFVQFMIRHHEGAVVMVKQLFAAPGAGQEPELYRFASDVEADQLAEIQRMRALPVGR
jgi:uncharacterized protein (DUF305 family)